MSDTAKIFEYIKTFILPTNKQVPHEDEAGGLLTLLFRAIANNENRYSKQIEDSYTATIIQIGNSSTPVYVKHNNGVITKAQHSVSATNELEKVSSHGTGNYIVIKETFCCEINNNQEYLKYKKYYEQLAMKLVKHAACAYTYLDIQKQFNENTIESIKYQNGKGYNTTHFNFCTIIPTHYIITNREVYIPSINAVLLVDNLKPFKHHPFAVNNEFDVAEKILERNSFGFTGVINIIDNHNPYKKYYISYLNEIMCIESKIDSSKDDGIYLGYANDGRTLTNTVIPLKNKNNYSIFDTQEEAIYQGNSDLKSLNHRRELEDISHRHNIQTLKEKRNLSELEHSIKTKEFTYTKIKLDSQHQIVVKSLQLELLKLENNIVNSNRGPLKDLAIVTPNIIKITDSIIGVFNKLFF